MRKGWWKPFVSGAIGAGISAYKQHKEGKGISLSGVIEGAKQGHALHENIREKYSVPWMGKGKKRGKKRVSKKKKKSKK